MNNQPLKVLSVFGTRPEAVKMAPVVECLRNTPGVISHICVTAQHREMLDQVLSIFGIEPDYDLNLMRVNQNLAQLTASICLGLDPVLEIEKPDWVLVQGDTTTVMASALCAFYRKIKVGHVEAGLRTFDRFQPFPEEINRRLAGVLADLHFAPTERARQNLLREGVEESQIVVTGNTVIDALQKIMLLPESPQVDTWLQKLGFNEGKRDLIVVTAHRRENFDEPIRNICEAIHTLAEKYPDRLAFIYPVHLNPNIQQPVHAILNNMQNVLLIDPIEYLPMISLLKRAFLVLTDSGGIQEEATGLGKPTLVLREVTERPEGVEAGVLKLVGTGTSRIIAETSLLIEDRTAYQKMSHAANPFGDGHAAERIVQTLLDHSSDTIST